MPDPLVELFVVGTPIPQGSKGAHVVAGRAILFDTNSKVLRPWRKAVKHAAEAVWRDEGNAPISVPVQATVLFVFPPVASMPDRHWVAGTPDLDKILRALMDGCTDAKLWVDDALVVKVLASKRYAEPGEPAGAHIAVDSLAQHESLASTRRRNERTRTR